MKKTFVLMTVLSTLALSGNAQDKSATNWKFTCGKVGDLAEAVMKSRQAGVAMAKSIQFAGDDKLTERIVIAAYDQPRYSTKSIQENTINDFRDEWYAWCVKNIRK